MKRPNRRIGSSLLLGGVWTGYDVCPTTGRRAERSHWRRSSQPNLREGGIESELDSELMSPVSLVTSLLESHL